MADPVHNWSQPFNYDYDLVSHVINYVVCVLTLHMNGRTYSLKLIPNNRFLWNFSWQFFISSQSFCQKSAERKSPKKYFFIFRFVEDKSDKPYILHIDRKNLNRFYFGVFNRDFQTLITDKSQLVEATFVKLIVI